MTAVFLSAGVPDAKKSPEHAMSADPVAIASAVSALTYALLGRRQLVWGGHPAITPMIATVAKSLQIDPAEWVTLYQSDFFDDQFPDENKDFARIVHTTKQSTRDASLAEMRWRMLTESTFESAVFIGGMEGIIDEYEMFRSLHPFAKTVLVASTGGATLTLAKEYASDDSELFDDFEYVGLFNRRLDLPLDREGRPI